MSHSRIRELFDQLPAALAAGADPAETLGRLVPLVGAEQLHLARRTNQLLEEIRDELVRSRPAREPAASPRIRMGHPSDRSLLDAAEKDEG